MIIYDDLKDFRKIYTYHSKESLERNNEIVLLASSYESPDKIKSNLESAGVDVAKYISGGSLMIIDSLRGYHMGDVYGILKLIQSLQLRGQKEGKSGVVCFGDPGTFFMLDKRQELVDYELTIPKKVDMKSRTFCCYHRGDFNSFTRQQKKQLLEGHLRAL